MIPRDPMVTIERAGAVDQYGRLAGARRSEDASVDVAGGRIDEPDATGERGDDQPAIVQVCERDGVAAALGATRCRYRIELVLQLAGVGVA